MSNDAFASEILARKFAARTRSERKRWRRIMRCTGGERRALKGWKKSTHGAGLKEKHCRCQLADQISLPTTLGDPTHASGTDKTVSCGLPRGNEALTRGMALGKMCGSIPTLRALGVLHRPVSESSQACCESIARLEAWTLLNGMAMRNPDNAKIQWFAYCTTTYHSFAERFRQFMSNVDDSHANEVAAPSRMPFWGAGPLLGTYAAEERAVYPPDAAADSALGEMGRE